METCTVYKAIYEVSKDHTKRFMRVNGGDILAWSNRLKRVVIVSYANVEYDLKLNDFQTDDKNIMFREFIGKWNEVPRDEYMKSLMIGKPTHIQTDTDTDLEGNDYFNISFQDEYIYKPILIGTYCGNVKYYVWEEQLWKIN